VFALSFFQIKPGSILRACPPGKETLDDQQIWQVVLFIRHLPASANQPSQASGNNSRRDQSPDLQMIRALDGPITASPNDSI